MLRVHLVPRVRKVNLVPTVLLGTLVQQAPQVLLVRKVQREHMAGKDLVELRELLDHRLAMQYPALWIDIETAIEYSVGYNW